MKTETALVIIDMINDFVDPKGALYISEAFKCIAPILVLSKNVHKIYVVKEAHTPNDSEFKDWPPHGIKGTWGSELFPALLKHLPAFTLIEKDTLSMSPSQARSILEYRTLVCGVATELCIAQNAKLLKSTGHSTFIVVDAVVGIDPININRELLYLGNFKIYPINSTFDVSKIQ